jgi:hypothetical protein
MSLKRVGRAQNSRFGSTMHARGVSSVWESAGSAASAPLNRLVRPLGLGQPFPDPFDPVLVAAEAEPDLELPPLPPQHPEAT